MIATSPASLDELVRRLAVILAITTIVAVSGWIVVPFLPAIVWAATIAIATWPVLLRLQSRFGGRRAAATTILTLLLLAGFFVPLLLATGAVVGHADDAATLAHDIAAHGLPAAPAWLERIPLVGPRLAAEWSSLAQLDAPLLRERLEPLLRAARRWLVGSAGSLLHLVLQVLLTVVVTALFYANGDAIAAAVRAFLRRVGGDAADSLGVLAAGSARAVALGVVVTAVLQALAVGVALSLARVPGAVLLGGLTLVLCLAQLGSPLVMLPVIVWLFGSGRPGTAVAMVAVLVGLAVIDNVLKPVLITRGAKLPLLLVFLGVIGGMLAFGVIGIFIGPVVLAVGWTLLRAWVGGASVAGTASGGTEAGAA